MTTRLYIRKPALYGGTDSEFTAYTGRKGTPFFDGQQSLVELGMRCYQGEASQGEFVLTDPDADFNVTSDFPLGHTLVTWTEDAPGAEVWLFRGRVANDDGGRGDTPIDNETQWNITVDDCNMDLRGQAFTESWVRPEETDIARLVALQAYTLNGASSTATYHRDTCDITVNTSHLAPNANTVTMPAKKYLPGTQPQEVVADCAEMAGKVYGVVIHHTGGSHLCLFYTVYDDHTTYLSPITISDEITEWDPDHPTDPVVEPHWERGPGTTFQMQTMLSGMVGIYNTEDATFVQNTPSVDNYDYWVEAYHDGKSTDATQAAARTSEILFTRLQTYVTHRISIIINADQVDMVGAGMSIASRTAVTSFGFPEQYFTRRIAECRFEPRHDGRYWAHLDIERPTLRVAPGRGQAGPYPPVQDEPPGGPITDYLWTYSSSNLDDTTNTYPVGNELGSQWHPGYVHAHVIQPSVGNYSEVHPPIGAGTFHFRAQIRRGGTTYNPGGINIKVHAWDGGIDTLVWTSPTVTAIIDTEVSDDIIFPVGTDAFSFTVDFNDSYMAETELSHGTASIGFVGTPLPGAPGSAGTSGVMGTSPIYMPIDTVLPAQIAEDTPIQDAGGYFTGGNVEEALQELGAGSGAAGFFNVRNYGATGDATTDDTTAINGAITALIAAGAGVLYFPAGTYKTTSALTTISVPCIVRGDGSNDYDGNSPISLVTSTSDTANLFTITADHAKFENIAFRNDEGNPSAGSAVSTQGAHLEQRVDFESIVVHSFYIGLDVQVGGQWSMRDCFIYDPVLYGVKIRNTVNDDAGDWTISDTEISADSRAATAGIRIESSGGGKINNVKINMGYPADQKFTDGIQLAVASGVVTVILLVTNCSFENVTGHGISVTSTGTGEWRNLVFNGNQFGLWTNNAGKAINIAPTNTNDVEDIVIANNIFHTDGTARSAVQLTNTDNVVLVGNLLTGNFTSLYTNTGSTNIVEISGSSALDDLTDVTITTPAEGDMLRYDGAEWVNTPGRWEPVTDGVDTFVWDGDDLVMAWTET